MLANVSQKWHMPNLVYLPLPPVLIIKNFSMKITSVTGVTQIENVKCFKPVSKVFVKIIYPADNVVPNESDPNIRIRLVDGANGSSREVVPEMRLSILSEIASKFEGFQRKASHVLNSAGAGSHLEGFSLSTIILGGSVNADVVSAVDLSNDKYVDIDLHDLNPSCIYEVWGFESHIIAPFCRTYQKFYLSSGEIEKRFSSGENELLVLPINQVKEIQMFPKDGLASPVFRREELILDSDGSNDLVSVELDNNNLCRVELMDNHVSIPETYLPIKFGYSVWHVMSLVDFAAFEIRREDGIDALTFLMIDTVPSAVAVA
jgi:hypothetical protein